MTSYGLLLVVKTRSRLIGDFLCVINCLGNRSLRNRRCGRNLHRSGRLLRLESLLLIGRSLRLLILLIIRLLVRKR